MSRPYHPLTLDILNALSQKDGQSFRDLYNTLGASLSYKFFYNILYRLQTDGLIEKRDNSGQLRAYITRDGKILLVRKKPNRDGIWKLVIFDVPEKHKYVRNVLRAKLKSLGFKKWQNSIWISPFILDAEVESELSELAKKFFVRLIKTTEINRTDDLEDLFKRRGK